MNKYLTHPLVRKVINKKTLMWFAILKLLTYAIIGAFFLVHTYNADAASNTQVKIATDSKIYYLDYKTGRKKPYISEKVFLSYGNNWSEVTTISAMELNNWPTAKLIKTSQSGIFYIKNNAKCALSASSRAQFGLTTEPVISVNRFELNSYRTANCSNLISAVGGEEVQPDDLKQLRLDTASYTAQPVLPSGSTRNLVGRFRLTADTQPTEVTGLIMDVKGIYRSGAISKIYLVVAGQNIDQTSEVSNRQAQFNLNQTPIEVAANSSVTFDVLVDINPNAGDVTNNTIIIGFAQPESIITTAEVTGSFPVQASSNTLLNGNNLLGTLSSTELPTPTQNLTIGTADQIIAKFKLAETSGHEDVYLNTLVLQNKAALTTGDITDLKLRDTNNATLATAQIDQAGQIIFNLHNFKIKKNQAKTLSVTADIVQGDTHSINLDVSRLEAVGSTYAFVVASSQTDLSETQTISRLRFGAESADLKLTATVNKNQAGALLGHFRIKNPKQTVLMDNITVILNQNQSSPAITGNLYLINYQTGEIIDNQPAKTGEIAFKFHNYKFTPNKQLDLAVIADLPETVDNGDQYSIDLSGLNYRTQDNNPVHDDLKVTGSIFYASKASIYIYANNNLTATDLNYTKGQKQVKIASFNIEASDSENVIVKNMSFVRGSQTQSNVLSSVGFSNVRAYIGGTRAKTIVTDPQSSRLFFEGLNYSLKAGQRAEIKVYADINKDLQVDDAQLALENILAINTKTGQEAKITGNNTDAPLVKFASLTAEMNLGSTGSYSPATKNNVLANFTVTNNSQEKISLKYLTITSRDQSLSNSLGFSNLAIINADTNRKVGSVSKPVAEVNKINLNSYSVKPGETINLNLTIDTNGAVPVNSLNITISNLEFRGSQSSLNAVASGGGSGAVAGNGTATVDTPVVTTITKLRWPTDSHTVNYGFHDPTYPFHDQFEHNAIDIDASQGSPVYAAADGIVSESINTHTTDFNYVRISHSSSLETGYGHLSRIDVNPGDHVVAGQVIGLSGGRPGTIGAGAYSTGSHLHFEVIKNGDYVDPIPFLK